MGKHSQKNRTNKHPPLASTAKPRKNYRAFILPAILLIAFVIRVSLIPSAEKMPFNYMSDSRMYADKAMLILDGKETEAVSHQGPLYPYFIAGICIAELGSAFQRHHPTQILRRVLFFFILEEPDAT